MITMILLAILMLLVFVAGIAYLNFNGRINREVRGLLSGAKSGAGTVVIGEMIRTLPEPVQRYLAYSGVLGKQMPRTIRLKQIGKIRQDEKSAWMKLEAVEYYSTTPPAFIWKAFLPTRRFPLTLGRSQPSEQELGRKPDYPAERKDERNDPHRMGKEFERGDLSGRASTSILEERFIPAEVKWFLAWGCIPAGMEFSFFRAKRHNRRPVVS